MDWRQKARLRPSELAEVGSVSLARVRRKIASGEIESYVQDGCRFVPIAAALRFVGEESETPSHGHSVKVGARARAFVARIRREAG